MTPDELTERATAFGLRVVRFVEPLFDRPPTRDIADQLNRADESHHWLSFLRDAGFASGSELGALIQEAHELRSIFGKSVGTSRRNLRRSTKPRRPRRHAR